MCVTLFILDLRGANNVTELREQSILHGEGGAGGEQAARLTAPYPPHPCHTLGNCNAALANRHTRSRSGGC